MIKLVIKLAVAALVANACWRLGSAYSSFYRFKDGVHQAALFGAGRTESELQARVLELAAQYDVPVTPDDFTIRRENDHTIIEGGYTRTVDLAPGYARPWTFSWSVDAYAAKPVKLDAVAGGS